MRRRTFIAGLLVAATAGRAQAQRSAKVYRIARIYPAQPVAEAIKASKTQGSIAWFFFEELRRLGFVEGQNLVYERYSAEGRCSSERSAHCTWGHCIAAERSGVRGRLRHHRHPGCSEGT